MDKIKISIVEDEPEFQQWIVQALAETQDIQCISIHSDGEEAMAGIPYHKPDIILMDLTLENSKFNGFDCIIRLSINWPDLKFLVLSAHSDESRIFEAIRVGAGAYIHKEEITKEHLIESIYEFYKGGAPMSPGIAKCVIKNLQQPKEDLVRLQTLTPREKGVLEHLSKGKLYKEVADMLKIKEGTIKQHAYNIYQKLQVNNCAEAIRKYFFKFL